MIKVLRIGTGLSLQDYGRPGWRRYGVAPAGAMDQHAMAQANRLVGNLPGLPVLELMLSGAKLKLLEDCWLGLAGADLGCTQLETWSARHVKAGSVLEFKGGAQGLWAYLSICGGFAGTKYLGSVSADLRAGLGTPIQAGDVLRAPRQDVWAFPRVARRIVPPELRRAYPESVRFELLPGPQFTTFSEESKALLVSRQWRVSARSDKTGYRIEGGALQSGESIHSEPVLPGSFQITTDGRCIVTMTHGPTVGGYAKIAVLKSADLDRFAQCRPGTKLNFTWAG